MVRRARGIVKVEEVRIKIHFCVDEIKHHHFAVVY